MASKEVLVDLEEKFNKVCKLLYIDSKTDPENDPYQSKYAARKILEDLKGIIADMPQTSRTIAMLGAVQLYSGIAYLETEESSSGEDELKSCETTIKDCLMSPEVVAIALNLYNQLGCIWAQREAEKGKYLLEKAESIYVDFKKLGATPIDIADLFKMEPTAKDEDAAIKSFEKAYTLTLFYLAQLYGALKDTLKSSVFCHVTLQRQLESDDYDPIDWALNAATLSQFFMEKDAFKQARHHLAASSYMLDKYEKELESMEESSEAQEAKIETFKHRSADVARCWAKYGLLLLSRSKERLMNRTDDDDEDEKEGEKEDETKAITSELNNLDLSSVIADLQNLEFTSLDLTSYEAQITSNHVLTIQDARLVFLNVQKWLSRAEEYYTLDNLASDHIEITLDKVQMYYNYLFFEDVPENQAKLHKRRIDLLENLINKVNPQYYLQYCRQIWFELAHTYFDIVDIKNDLLRESDARPSPHALTKLNHLVERGLHNYTCFIDSFKDKITGEAPSEVPEDYEKPFLQAYFHIAVLNSRFVTLDKKAQLDNVEASYRAYKKVKDYCEQHNKAREHIPTELSVAVEMVSLLPLKIAKLRQELA